MDRELHEVWHVVTVGNGDYQYDYICACGQVGSIKVDERQLGHPEIAVSDDEFHRVAEHNELLKYKKMLNYTEELRKLRYYE